jgi:hypothetical protein
MAVAAGPDLYRQLDAFLTKLDPERDAVLAQGSAPAAKFGVARVRRART